MCAFLFFYRIIMKNIEKLLEVAEKRIQYFIDQKISRYTGHKVFLDWLIEEIDEAKQEIRENNSVYLEDELGDVFWDMMCLLTSLEKEWLIKKEKVFERAYNKFSERIDHVQSNDENTSWEEIKKIQKIKRQKEHDDLYNS